MFFSELVKITRLYSGLQLPLYRSSVELLGQLVDQGLGKARSYVGETQLDPARDLFPSQQPGFFKSYSFAPKLPSRAHLPGYLVSLVAQVRLLSHCPNTLPWPVLGPVGPKAPLGPVCSIGPQVGAFWGRWEGPVGARHQAQILCS